AGQQEPIDSIFTIAELYGLSVAPNDYDVSIASDDSIAGDKSAEITKQIELIHAGIQSKKRAILKVHGVTEDEALEILYEINEEEKAASPDLEELERESVLFGERE